MRTRAIAGAIAAVGALLAAVYAGYQLGSHRSMAPAADAQGNAGRQVLYWYDPMYPQQKFDKPGKSPFMDMQLVPKYADEGKAGADVTISPRVVQNLGIRTAQAKSGTLEERFEAVGAIAYNERATVQLQARAAGFVEKLHARAPLDMVARGAPLVQILFPDWAGAQEEYLLLRRQGSADSSLAEAARRRLALLGMNEAEIAAVEKDGKPHPRITLVSPVTGVIAELGVRDGMTVAPGMTLFRLVDLSTVWVNAEVPETRAGWIKPGSRVIARVPAYPESRFDGRVGAILPEVNASTRTLRARIELANPGLRLKPGMFATLAFEGASREVVLVPGEALIRTGQRDVVIVALDEGRFRAAQVEVGAEAAGETEIRSGLKPGEKVVLSGQFLIDSEASLTGALARLEGGGEPKKPAGEPASGAEWHKGSGKVLGVDAAAGKVELEHEAIPSMQWPPMTMGFLVRDKSQLAGLKKGDAVEFETSAKPDRDGNYMIRSIVPRRSK